MMSKILLAILLAATQTAFAKSLLITNAVVHTVSGADIRNGQTLVVDGKISAVAEASAHLTADETIDLEGAHLYPGFILPISSVGLIEIDSVRGTVDTAESGEFKPEVQAWLAVDPDSEIIAATRANGVLHSVAVPAGGMISGQSGLIQMGGGWTVEDLAARKSTAMHLFWPGMELDTTPRELARDKERWKSLEDQAKDRRLRLKDVENFFSEAEAYAADTRAETKRIPSWEAMIPVVRGEIPLVVHADSHAQIKAVIRFAADRKYRVIITGGRDSWKLAKELAEARIPVIFERIYNDGGALSSGTMRDTEPYDAHFSAPAKLAAAGVKFAISGGLGGDEATTARNLPYLAAQAMAFGLSREDALKSITLNVAEIYGFADRLGAIAVGKEATMFVSTGDALDIRSQVKRVWIKGQAVSIENKQTRLYQRYQSRPRR